MNPVTNSNQSQNNFPKYFKPYFIPNVLFLNSLCLLYYIFPYSIESYLGVVSLLLLLLKFFHGCRYTSLQIIDYNECVMLLMERVNIQFIRLNWLINKFNKECFRCGVGIFLGFYVIDRWIYPSLSVWILVNMINAYLSFTKLSRNQVKYRLGLYRQYNKYVIKISEPNNHENQQKQETFAEIFEEFKNI